MIIKIVTISLMAVFYICYFAKLISQKKQGIKTDQLGKGKFYCFCYTDEGELESRCARRRKVQFSNNGHLFY